MKVVSSLGAMFMAIIMGMREFHSAVAFTLVPVSSTRPSKPFMRSSVASSTDTIDENNNDVIDVVSTDATAVEKRAALLNLANDLRNLYGVFWNALWLSKSKQDELMEAVAALEDEKSSLDSVWELLPGDWNLIGTLSYSEKDIPFLEPLQNALSSVTASAPSPLIALSNRFVTVTQRIRCMDKVNEINRVDHVIQYQPPQQLGDLVVGEGTDASSSSSSWWNNININPLSISKSQVTLVHKAEIVDRNATPPKIRLQLQSVVNNLAGTSGILDPNGADVLGVNVPQLFPNDNTKELYDSLGGAFVTTYVDAALRISRSDVAGGTRKQLRIFQRQAQNDTVVVLPPSDEIEEDAEGATPVEPPSDVDE
jgi:hypothetical protein